MLDLTALSHTAVTPPVVTAMTRSAAVKNTIIIFWAPKGDLCKSNTEGVLKLEVRIARVRVTKRKKGNRGKCVHDSLVFNDG